MNDEQIVGLILATVVYYWQKKYARWFQRVESEAQLLPQPITAISKC